jgi:tetratricopeptide (TPR) repeat protein
MVKLPPPILPDGLPEVEYRKLSVLYMLMGRMDLARQANDKCTPVTNDKVLNEMTVAEQFEFGSIAGRDFAFKLLQVLEEASKQPSNMTPQFEAAMKPFRGFIPDDVLDNLSTTLSASIEESRAEPQPSRDVPSGLSADEYFKLGQKYKTLGWTEQAREALQLCINLDGGGALSDSALQYLRTRVPRYPVPLAAEQLNIQGVNLMQSDKNLPSAKKIFLELTKRYPDFEWPYGNLGSIYLQTAQLEKAEDMFIEAIKVNPYYANGWLGLGRVNIFKSDFNQAKYCFNKAAEIESDSAMVAFISLAEQIEDWDTDIPLAS